MEFISITCGAIFRDFSDNIGDISSRDEQSISNHEIRDVLADKATVHTADCARSRRKLIPMCCKSELKKEKKKRREKKRRKKN